MKNIDVATNTPDLTFVVVVETPFICNQFEIQQIGVRIGCYGLRRGTHLCPSIVIRVMSLVGHGGDLTMTISMPIYVTESTATVIDQIITNMPAQCYSVDVINNLI
jgi:hypothetical protein